MAVKIPLDWDEITKLASYECTIEEIAAFFDVSDDTLKNRCLELYGISFSDFLKQKRRTGKAKVRKIQMQLLEQGSVPMAIWLGKQKLGQSDKSIDQELIEEASRAGLTRDQLLNIIRANNEKMLVEPKRSFAEFCIKAKYPLPFEKQTEMMVFGMDQYIPRMILGARGYGKTDYVTILGTAYDIYFNGATSTNLIISKSKTRNAALIEEIANALELNDVKIDKRNSNCIRIHGLLGKDHSVEALTIKSSMRGRHPKRVIMDDPVTDEDVSEATRLLVKRRFDEVMKLCSNVLVIGQPAHKLDLYAGLRDLIKTMLVPFGSIPELDADLEAQRLAGVDENSIKMSYFLEIPKDGAAPFDNVKYLDTFPTGQSAVAWIDPSFEGGDYTALSIIKQYMDGIAVVGFCFKKSWNHALDDIVPLLSKYNVGKLGFETNSLGEQPVDMLRKLLANTGIGVTGRKSILNKHSKIMSAGAYAHLIHLSKESHKVYLDQVAQYEYNSKHDDAPDSLASCLEWIGLIRGKK